MTRDSSIPYECSETQDILRFWEDPDSVSWADAIHFLIQEGSVLAKLNGVEMEKLIVGSWSKI